VRALRVRALASQALTVRHSGPADPLSPRHCSTLNSTGARIQGVHRPIEGWDTTLNGKLPTIAKTV